MMSIFKGSVEAGIAADASRAAIRGGPIPVGHARPPRATYRAPQVPPRSPKISPPLAPSRIPEKPAPIDAGHCIPTLHPPAHRILARAPARSRWVPLCSTALGATAPTSPQGRLFPDQPVLPWGHNRLSLWWVHPVHPVMQGTASPTLLTPHLRGQVPCQCARRVNPMTGGVAALNLRPPGGMPPASSPDGPWRRTHQKRRRTEMERGLVFRPTPGDKVVHALTSTLRSAAGTTEVGDRAPPQARPLCQPLAVAESNQHTGYESCVLKVFEKRSLRIAARSPAALATHLGRSRVTTRGLWGALQESSIKS